MKLILALCALCVLCGSNLFAATNDLRTVNGIRVNIGPVVEWFAKPSTNTRPMPHWKRIQVVELKEAVAGYQKCMVSIEGSAPTEVFIAHLPKRIPEVFQQLRDLKASTEAAQTQVAQARQNVRSALVDDRVDGQHFQHALNAASNTKGNAAGYAALYQAAASDPRPLQEFAMSTGQKYSGLAVWDCGSTLH